MYEEIINLAHNSESFYLYDEAVIKIQIAKLKNNFGGIEFLYSVKCNPNRNVLKTVFESGFGADAASLNEVKMAAESGLTKDQIYYSAPGKSSQDIRESLPYATIIADSLSEVTRISKAAGDNRVDIGIRINPDFGFDGPDGGASKFGIDEPEAMEFLRSSVPKNIRVTGIHVHLKSQELNADKLEAYHRNMLSLAERTEAVLGYELDYINLGSGIGVPYSPEAVEIDIEKLGRKTEKLVSEYKAAHPGTRIFIESGRYVVCQSGIYVTHVADKKVSRGKTFVILKNTLNGFMRPSIVCLVEKYAKDGPMPMYEPLFTCADAFTIAVPDEKDEKETVTLVGNLCTSTDIIADNITLPVLDIGDAVVITNAGAYAAVITPMQFASQHAPAEYMLLENGQLIE